MRLPLALALVAGLSSPAHALDSDGTEPDPVLTPGAVRTTDKAEICGHTTGEFRDVTATEKVAARRAYGLMSAHAGWCVGPEGCEIDHAIPLVVGGGNPTGSIANLWPQRSTGPNNYHVKDRCEAAAGRALCAGKLTVQEAQDMFRTDWIGHCAAFMGSH